MKSKRFIIYLLMAFIAGTILLIYIQYNSAKNINLLISGNEKYLAEYNINSQLKGLEKDVAKIESNVGDIISTGDAEYIKDLQTKIAKVRDDLNQLQQISDDDSTVKEVDELDSVIQKKIDFSKTLLDSFYINGKASAEKLMGTLRGKKLMDSIYLIVQNIENTRQGILTRITVLNNESGEKAKRFNTVLIILVLCCGAGLFWYIINALRKREYLIQQLHISETKVRQVAQVKENFMANMSHEIRTPMNAILGFTNLLQRKSLDEDSKEYVQSIQKSGENLLTIINDVLDLSKIEAGMMRIESTPFSIRGLLHSIEVMFHAKAAEKGIQIDTVIDGSVPDTLEGDATRLTQIFVNLIGNALKFTKKGSISIKISDEGKMDTFIKTGITISDTGIGIDKDKLEHIFDRFQQADDTVTRNYGGTGLGLSIVKDLVMLQDGTIDVKSQPGTGTSFLLTIPYKIADQQQLSDSFLKATDPRSLSGFTDVCILVVEDNEINQSLIKHLFKNWGLEYDLAKNGKEAIEKLRIKKYHLILMDIQMPVMDGYTAVQEIRENLKLNTPIIAMTAHAFPGENEKCLSYGMNDYISKPIREDQLYKLIAKFCNIAIPGMPHASFKDARPYKYINLDYMKEIGRGNTEYEQLVTQQFIDAIPQDLLAIENAWKIKAVDELKQLAHNMKTTISVMGLNETLQPYLDTFEYKELNEVSFNDNFQSLKLICNNSLSEARLFLATF